MRTLNDLVGFGLQKLVWTATFFVILGCAEKSDLEEKIAELNESLMQRTALSIQKLERLNREHPEDPRVLELLAYANLALPEKNHRLAALYFEDASRKGNPALRLLAAKHFEIAGDPNAQIRNICLHLKENEEDERQWLALGQVLIQSNEELHLELAQQILFKEKNLTAATIKKQRLDYLNLLLIDLDSSNQGWVNEGIAGNEGEVIATELLPVSDDEAISEVQLVTLFDLQPNRPDAEQVAETAAAGLVGKFGGQGVPGTQTFSIYQQKESPHSTEEEDNGDLDKDIAEPIEEDSEVNSEIINDSQNTEVLPETPEEENDQTEVTESPKHETSDLIEAGHTAMLEGNYESATKAYWKVAKQDSENPEVWLNLSKAFRLGKEFKKAEMMALEASRRGPQNPKYLVYYLRVLHETADPQTYFNELKKARKIFPNEPYILLGLAEQYAALDDDLRAARILYNEFLDAYPNHPRKKEVEKALELIGY